MNFTIYRDLASISFIRCISPISGENICAEGTGFTVTAAIAKCRSECIEGKFQISHPLGSQMLGIAAHPEAKNSAVHAWNETLETLVLKQLAMVSTFWGFSISIFQTKICLGRVEDRFVALGFFSHRGIPTATQAVSKNPLKALVKTWAEVRNVRLYNPAPEKLSSYTKANRLLSAAQLSKIIFTPSFRKNPVATNNLRQFEHQDQNHYITYFIQETRI